MISLVTRENVASQGVARKLGVLYGETKGILIALENYANEPGETLAEIQTVLDHFPVSTLNTNIDTENYAGWKQDLLEAIDGIGDRVAYVHAKDLSEGGISVPGEGDLPMKEIFAALDALRKGSSTASSFRATTIRRIGSGGDSRS